MQSTQTVLHNENELKTYLDTAMVLLAERAGHPRTDATPDAVLIDISEATALKKPDEAPSKVTNAVVPYSEPNRGIRGTSLPQPVEEPVADPQPGAPLERNSVSLAHGPSGLLPYTGLREALMVTIDDFVTIPLVVDIWVTRCAPNVPLFKYSQPEHFAGE